MTVDIINRNSSTDILLLKATGSILESNSSAQDDGLLRTISNYPMRGLLWRIESVCFNWQDNEFAVYDERGQINILSLSSNSYRFVRLASTPISAMTFIAADRHSQLLIAYENGETLLVDTVTGDVLSNLTATFQGLLFPSISSHAIIRLLKPHPSKPLVISATDASIVSLWDLRFDIYLWQI